MESDVVDHEVDPEDENSEGFPEKQVEMSFIDQQALENGQKLLTPIFHKLIANTTTASDTHWDLGQY